MLRVLSGPACVSRHHAVLRLPRAGTPGAPAPAADLGKAFSRFIECYSALRAMPKTKWMECPMETCGKPCDVSCPRIPQLVALSALDDSELDFCVRASSLFVACGFVRVAA